MTSNDVDVFRSANNWFVKKSHLLLYLKSAQETGLILKISSLCLSKHKSYDASNMASQPVLQKVMKSLKNSRSRSSVNFKDTDLKFSDLSYLYWCYIW